ncbi:DNA-directed RNA polymerase 2, chloroplastic/mitochondrial [Dorcoceras hygrometricum]|uniref:DNA-directed RNA polymerase 2, chloroplastic/mitochondrial n=1 Tax=Dorcoceras hygrometricum TaxID=472368 RepID=A0A2Z7A2M5_9LAMI|nr:DNA-directed RNA polymerase 2, chloroplastic/mitochondrial [Dorcoceras hygrometricum]
MTPLLSPRARWRAVGRPLKHAGRRCATLDGRPLRRWSTLRTLRCASRDGARAAAAFFMVATPPSPAAAPPPLRRVSGDVVTAGLNSSRVWFGPVPGSP